MVEKVAENAFTKRLFKLKIKWNNTVFALQDTFQK